MNLLKYITKTASCPTFGDWAIANKRTVKWGSQKRGDIVLFDFNHNGLPECSREVIEAKADLREFDENE